MATFEKGSSALPKILQNLTALQISITVIVLFFTRWVLQGIYRLYFHPLSHFPGPRFSAFTRIPQLYATFTGNLPFYVADCHNKYGHVVRISPYEISFTNSEAWRDIYGYGSKTGLGSAPPKHWPRYGTSPNGVPSLLQDSDDTNHARVRKIFSPAFSERAIKEQEPLFMKYIDDLVQILKDGTVSSTTGTATYDVVDLYSFTTFDVMSDLTFGESLHMLKTGTYDPWVGTVLGFMKASLRINLINTHYPLAAKVLKPIMEFLFSKTRSRLFDTNSKRVTKRLEKGRESKVGVDLWDLVLNQEEKGKQGLNRGEMDSNATTFMVAGTETTATLLTGLTYLLLTHPECQAKLVKEIRTTFQEEASINMEAIAKLPYLKACIQEAFRLYPPVAVGLLHLTPSDGSTVCGHFVPPNTTVSATHYAMYTSARNFTDPLCFIPERWTDDARFANDDRAAVQPFSVGPRDCLGKNMAYHEMRLIITKVLWNFDLELPEGNGNWFDQTVFTLWQKGPLNVKVRMAQQA
ncbi:hypothetical protein AA0119_g4748 [Alternaria tenuissima]|uniref:Uncharacterized protein n=1 Tax=Alternaria tenuissima TaxID=119927 RepID=A0A4Q4PLI8_9PLEO|nr:hypothetical protein AA0115_g4509 [Alternaria tenuissima]RYO03453.1 hypothetical protein AA0119_g4748 [Alternaria tenuissima]RYO19528.1 hypothetical protein AA0121_g4315 [Alternaria tenuissima]RYO61244.1 Cytochrome P450 monooxygenase [Alternaria tenuissima]